MGTHRTPVLEIVEATVVKGDTRALDRVSLTIGEGEHTAILGPNGSGKSSLINLLTLDDRPLAKADDTPVVRIFGEDRWDLLELRSRLGVVSADMHHRFVNGNSAGRITGEDAVVSAFFSAYGFVLRPPITAAHRRRAAAALERLGAGHLAGKTLNRMSTGEARRVLIARALATDPQVLVLDEPAAGLDIVARKTLMELIRQIAAAGTTLILVTHHVEEIVPEIETVVLLSRGRIAGRGPRREMLTADNLAQVFGAPIELSEAEGHYYARI